MVESLKWFWASVWVYALGLGTIKMSILFQYLRFFTTRKWRIGCFVVMGLNIAVTMFGFFATMFMCSPVKAFWTPGTGQCLDRLAIW